VLEQIAEARVRLLGGAEPGELPHRPELPAVHRRVHAARKRIDAGIAEVVLIVDVDVVGRVQRLVLETRDGRRQLAVALRRGVVELAPPLLGFARRLRTVLCRRHRAVV
jgi:hypothetical protein